VQAGSFAKITSTVVAVILIGTVAWLKNQPQSTTGTFPPASVASQAPGRYDLGHDEALGGHTLQRHVGRTDEQLVERLAREPDISAASTYSDRAAAEKTVSDALAQEKSRVEAWLNRPDAHPNLALQFHGHNPIGRSIRRGDHASQPCYDAAVILRWDGDHRFHVLTTYPEPARAR
jgi:Bacterial CdiA-CT RNAse A domain